MPEKNTSTLENLSCFSNEFSVQADWLKIPYGDHLHQPTGVIQRLTRQVAETMSDSFKSFAARLGRLFGGSPVFVGHPDDPKLANEYPDKKSYGWIMDMEAREDGFYLKPKWSSAGEELIANAFYKWFSPFWGCSDIARENGKRIVAPTRLISLGLTNSPNIEGILPLANDKQSPKGVSKEMKEKLITLLGLANEATDEHILTAATALKTAKDAADLALSNEKAAKATAETALSNAKIAETSLQTQITASASALANERKARIELVLDNAQAAGKITPAQRPQRAADLLVLSNVEGGKDFDVKLVELSNAKPVMNTESKTKDLGKRNSDTVAQRDASIRRDKVLNLVNEKMQKTGADYETAFANIRKEQPVLFAEMQQPQKK